MISQTSEHALRAILFLAQQPSGTAVSADRVARVVEGFEATRPSRVCLLGGRPCDDAAPCEAHFRWKALTGGLWEPLCRTTVADLLSQSVHGAGPNAGNSRSAAPAA